MVVAFNGRWVDTGDAGLIDADGYVHIMSRRFTVADNGRRSRIGILNPAENKEYVIQSHRIAYISELAPNSLYNFSRHSWGRLMI